jgi:hypothetical protein
MTTLDEKFLNKVWTQWNINRLAEMPYTQMYNRVARRGSIPQKFETWLFTEGAIVCRLNKKCFLHFTDSETALAFKLRHL